MRVAVLGSGSRGNAVAVSAAGTTILLDAGFGPKVIAQRAERSGVDLGSLAGIVLTHEHGDHARGARGLAKRMRCPVFGSAGTLSALAPRLGTAARQPIRAHEPVTIGPFHIEACHTSHDAAEPMAFTVRAGDSKVGIAYDLGRPTAAVRYLLRDVSLLLLEANHDELMLRVGPYPPTVRDRIAGAGGHLSNRVAAQLAAELAHDGLHTVVLVHVSDRCNRADLARDAVREALTRRPFRGRVLVAPQDVPLETIEVGPAPRQFDLGLAG